MKTKCEVYPEGVAWDSLSLPAGYWVFTDAAGLALVSGEGIADVVETGHQIASESGLNLDDSGLRQIPTEREKLFLYGGGSNATG